MCSRPAWCAERGRGAQGAAADGGRGPKKLSDIKVDPTIAASLGTLPAAPAPRAAAAPVAPAVPGSGAGRGAAPAAAAPASVLDLLGGLDSPAAAAAAPTGAAGSRAPPSHAVVRTVHAVAIVAVHKPRRNGAAPRTAKRAGARPAVLRFARMCCSSAQR